MNKLIENKSFEWSGQTIKLFYFNVLQTNIIISALRCEKVKLR